MYFLLSHHDNCLTHRPWHRDTTWNLTDATLITIAVALSEVSPRSGPTEFILGSHSFLGDLPSEEHQSSSHVSPKTRT